MTVTQFTGLIVGIALLLTLAGPLGAVGAAVASCGGYLVLFVMTAVLTGGRIAQFVPRRADLIDAFRRLL
jgi:biotin transporter BioY